MKRLIYLTTCLVSLCLLQASAQEKTSAYIVKFKGKGWGVTRKASSAISSQEGVKKLFLSGYRATVIMEEGKELSKAKTRSAIIDEGLSLVDFEKKLVLVPKAAYKIAVSGAGWAITNDKAREALEKIDGITGAYVNAGTIEIHLAEEGELDRGKINEALEPFSKIKIRSISTMKGPPF